MYFFLVCPTGCWCWVKKTYLRSSSSYVFIEITMHNFLCQSSGVPKSAISIIQTLNMFVLSSRSEWSLVILTLINVYILSNSLILACRSNYLLAARPVQIIWVELVFIFETIIKNYMTTFMWKVEIGDSGITTGFFFQVCHITFKELHFNSLNIK